MPDQITLYSAWYCPFAQRTWAALEYLDVPYAYQEIDPYNKSDHWLNISRGTGQVPVLTIATTGQAEMRIPDSLRTMEYLDDLYDGKSSLFPIGHLQKAEARFWLDFQGSKIIPYFYRFLKAKTGSTDADIAQRAMLAGLEEFSNAMSETGPFFFGSAPGIVDIAFAPFAFRIEVLLAHYKAFHLPESGANWSRFQTWSKAMQSHPAFVATMPSQDTYKSRLLDFYLPYSQGGGQQDVTAIP